MPRISRPHYNLHQIITGKFTSGDEFVYQNGEIYIGSYHILPTGQFFTGPRPEPYSIEIFEKRLNPTNDIITYNEITGNAVNKYVTPTSIQPQLTLDDYKRGKIQRFFVQKRNSPDNTIIEIDSTQYNSINTINNPGINGVTWNKLLIEWRISKIPKEDVYYLNLLQIQQSERNFPGIGRFLVNPLEFYR